jgi:hypothetical protein
MSGNPVNAATRPLSSQIVGSDIERQLFAYSIVFVTVC